jgi:hypothetical protein
LPDIAAPPQGEATWIAQRMRLNGLPMSLKSFRSHLQSDAVFQHYEAWARGRGTWEVRRSQQPGWQILSLKSRQYFITIQARETSAGAEGTITVSTPPSEARTSIDTEFPTPRSALIVNLQQYDDVGLASEHISLTSSRSVHIEAQAFAQLLERAGWQIVRDQRSVEVKRGHVLEAQRGAEHALLTLLPDHHHPAKTAIIIVWRKA